MFKIYSKGCEYALRALAQVPFDQWNKGFLAKEICQKADVPESSTRKILQSLVRVGFLKGMTGPGGGYILTKHPKSISLIEIIKTIDGAEVFDQCIMGLSACNNVSPCPIHHDWKKVKENILDQLSKSTLIDLMGVRKTKASIR